MLIKYLEFVLTRVFGTGVDTLVLWICSDYIFSSTYTGVNIISPTISFEAAVLSNFLCSYYWIWRCRIVNRGPGTFCKKFLIFNLSSVAGFLIKMMFLLLFEAIFGWDVVWCNLAALLISGLFNYFLTDVWVFRKPKTLLEENI